MKFNWPLPPGEPFPGETLRADGWQYRDLPNRVPPEMWDELLRIIGEDHYRVLATTSGTTGGKPWVRGQLFISPFGLKRLADRMKATGAGGVH